MSAATVVRTKADTIDLQGPMYRCNRPNISIGTDIARITEMRSFGHYKCREVLINEVWRSHFQDGHSILDCDRPWMGIEHTPNLQKEHLRVYHAAAGVLGALLAPSDLECTEPLIKTEKVLGASFIVYGGYPAWTIHPALASLHLYQLRVAHFIIEGGFADRFLDLLPNRGMRISTAIRRRDTDYLQNILSILEEHLVNLNIDWEGMNSDGRYWEIVHSLIDANLSSGYRGILPFCDDAAWQSYNGSLQWWFDRGASKFGIDDYWDDDPDSDDDDDD